MSKALMSVAMQNISDIVRVTIVDDNSSTDYSDLINTFIAWYSVYQITE